MPKRGMHTRPRRHSSRIKVFEDKNLLPTLPAEIVPPQLPAVRVVVVIRLQLIRMHMRALDEAAFAYALPVRERQRVVFDRAVEGRSPGATATVSVSIRDHDHLGGFLLAWKPTYLKTRMRPASSFSVAAPNRFCSCSAR